MKRKLLFAVLLAPVAAWAAAPQHFSVSATYAPPSKAGANGAVLVTFAGTDKDVHVNEEPSPRLKLDPGQTVLVDKQPPPPSRVVPYDPENAKYFDPAIPVSFPVALSPKAPKGPQNVAASVTYFYCSKREGWCRKGTTDVEIALSVP